MAWLQNTYTRRFNTRHRLWGRLFGDRYKAALVEGGSAYYYETLLDYIHLNPVRAGLISPAQGQSIMDYPWSSVAGAYIRPPRERVAWMAVEEGLRAFGFADTAKDRRAWLERLDRRADEEQAHAGKTAVPSTEDGKPPVADDRSSHLTKGGTGIPRHLPSRPCAWPEAALKKPRHRNYRASQESRAHGKAEAAKIVQAGLHQAGLRKADLASLPGSDPRKVAIAVRLREQTSVGLAWISEEPGMKSPTKASRQIRRRQREN